MSDIDISIFALALCDFDIDVGNTLSVRYPQFQLDGYDDEYLVNCCLPDGAHIHTDDWVYMVLHVSKSSILASQKMVPASSSKSKKDSKDTSKRDKEKGERRRKGERGSEKKKPSSSVPVSENMEKGNSDKEKGKQRKEKEKEEEDAENESTKETEAIVSSIPSTATLSASANAEPEESNSDHIILFGMAYFRNVQDKSVKRGAVQKSLLLLSTKPLFETYRPLMRQVLMKEMKEKLGRKEQKNLLKTVYESINTSGMSVQLSLFGESYPIQPQHLNEGEVEGASLVELVDSFGVDSMILWYALLLQKRILFCGQPASSVGNCCFAAPLLASPLPGFMEIISPYVALTHMEPIQAKTFIAGTTNPLFETKPQCFSMGSLINRTTVKLSSSDREFMKNVMSGIQDNKGEQCANSANLRVRQQFHHHTLQFLMALEEDKLSKHDRKHLANFKDTEIYKRYTKFFTANPQRRKETKLSGLELFRKMEKLENNKEEENVGVLIKSRMLYDLSNNLENLSAIGELVDVDGVSFIASFLSDENSQMRKYAVTVLAQLSISLKGQIAIMSDEVLPRVVQMVDDPMPNVVSAACYCLLKISTLFIGAQTLVSRGVTEVLLGLLSDRDRNLIVKHRAAATLLQIYRLAPSTPIPKTAEVRKVHSQLKTPDRAYFATILQLLDAWHEELPAIPIDEKMLSPLKGLNATKQGVPGSDEYPLPDADTRAAASSYLLSQLVKQPELVLELVEGGGVELILHNEELGESNKQLYRDSLALLCMIAESNFGRKKIIRYRVIDTLWSRLTDFKFPQLLFQVVRFMEICAQHRDTRKVMLDGDAVASLMEFLHTHTKQNSQTQLVALPAAGALRFLFLFEPVLTLSKDEVGHHDTLTRLATRTAGEGEDQTISLQLQQICCSILKMIDDRRENQSKMRA